MTAKPSNKPIPNPGSEEAIDLGCTCPVLDNGHGMGAWECEGKPKFWISSDCPIHGKESEWIKAREVD